MSKCRVAMVPVPWAGALSPGEASDTVVVSEGLAKAVLFMGAGSGIMVLPGPGLIGKMRLLKSYSFNAKLSL